MNATELFKADGKPAGVFFCEQCRIVKRTQEEAEKCCRPAICACGTEIKELHYSDCHACRQLRYALEDEERERNRFEKATKIPEAEYEGPVLCERVNYNDGYFRDTGELHDMLSDEDLLSDMTEGFPEDFIPPLYAWACHVDPICHLDLHTVLENACQEEPENWDSRRLKGTDDLKKALETFNDLNKEEVVWTPNYKLAVLLDIKQKQTPCPDTQ